MKQLELADFAYRRQRGIPQYAEYVHQGHPPRYPSFQMKLPILFLPWDQEGGVMCLLDPCQNSVLSSEEAIQDDMSNLGVCRCGVVKYAKYFQRNQAPNITYDVALKIMDKTQLELQKDDIFNEIRVMAQLQPAGFYGAYSSPHISQWECSSDNFNEYIAMDLAANGSLIMYSQKRLRSYKMDAIKKVIPTVTSREELEAKVHECVANAWTVEALRIFHGVMKGLAYMHAQNVCHLDIDPCNIVLDTNHVPRIIDFGSSEVMSNNGFAGLDNRLVKFKLMYVAQEVRQHNLHPVPRPGFLGAPADMWSAGVLLYQLLCFGYPKGQLALVCDTNWRQNLLKHAYGESGCLGEEGCLICFRAMCFPSVIYEIFRGLLMDGTPSSRLTAVQVCNLLTPLINSLEGIDPVNAFELNPLEL